MKHEPIKNIETDRLWLKQPTMNEQFTLWNIIRDEKVNRYYFPTPDRIFNKNGLSKDDVKDLAKAREIFMIQLNDWERQKPFYEAKIKSISDGDNNQKFTWSIFTKSGEVIGQITVQPKDEYIDSPEIRDIGWFINPLCQGNGYATEAATAILDYMFNEVGIKMIKTSAASINPASWKLMEKLGFSRTGEKQSTYLDEEGNIVTSYCYECNREMFLERGTSNRKIK